MEPKFEKTPLPGLLLITPASFADRRGYLAETFRADKYKKYGMDGEFVQDNQAFSRKGVLRGLHAQLRNPQAKLVRAVTGRIFDVVVDARPASPAFGRWYGHILSGENLKQLFIPEGFLHGFQVLSPSAIVHYKCSRLYVPGDEAGVIWNDPDLAIRWKVKKPVLSAKDRQNLSWKEFREQRGQTRK